MEIWLRHPIHGVKCASLEAEAAQDRANGWQDCLPYGRAPEPLETPLNAPKTASLDRADKSVPEYTYVQESAPTRTLGRPRKTEVRAAKGNEI